MNRYDHHFSYLEYIIFVTFDHASNGDFRIGGGSGMVNEHSNQAVKEHLLLWRLVALTSPASTSLANSIWLVDFSHPTF